MSKANYPHHTRLSLALGTVRAVPRCTLLALSHLTRPPMVQAGQPPTQQGWPVNAKAADAASIHTLPHRDMTSSQVCCTPAAVARDGAPSGAWKSQPLNPFLSRHVVHAPTPHAIKSTAAVAVKNQDQRKAGKHGLQDCIVLAMPYSLWTHSTRRLRTGLIVHASVVPWDADTISADRHPTSPSVLYGME
jgi:hypothetical protein